MKKIHFTGFSISVISMIFLFSFVTASFGNSRNIQIQNRPDIRLVNDSDHNQQSYMEDVQEQLQKSRELLNDLQRKREQASSEEEQQNLYAPVMKLTKELEHAERFSKNLDVIDPEPWLRNKTEMDAVLADLQVAYDEAFPLLHDRSKVSSRGGSPR